MELYYWKECKRWLDTPHLLIAGTTGSGKSVLLNSLIYTAMQLGGTFFFIDLKRVELKRYKRLASNLGMATEPHQVDNVLDHAISIMEQRYKTMKGVEGDDPHIYIVIDELADLIYSCPKSCLEKVVKIGRLGRAAHVHLICATQDPSKKTLSAHLMQNFTTRIALRCFSPIESRQIIGDKGAENLPQYGYGLVRTSYGIRKEEIPFTPEFDINALVREMSYPKYFINAIKY